MRVKEITRTGISLPSHLTSCELTTLRRVFVNSYGGVTVKRRLRRLKYTVSGIFPQYIALLVNRTYFTLLNISHAKIPTASGSVTKKYNPYKSELNF